ncbi:MAG: DUF975 family protein [Lachnospiraceae bacterium]|nr:DUF975 family protein [Lachnospiraceae bacterium]
MNMTTWDRPTIKERAKEGFKRNYWWCVLAALILSLLIGGGSSNSNDKDKKSDNKGISSYTTQIFTDQGESFTDKVTDKVTDKAAGLVGGKAYGVAKAALGFTAGMVVLFVAVILIIVFAISLILKALVFNPLEMGGRKFFLKNQIEEEKGIGCYLDGFHGGTYGNVVVTMLVRDVKIFLWMLLLIIPGIIKSYEYRMVPYILAEHPELNYSDVLRMSSEMMDGQKMNAFVLDLSFIGWFILSGITAGIVGIFWTNPYYYSADAELYLTLSSSGIRSSQDTTAQNDQFGSVSPY